MAGRPPRLIVLVSDEREPKATVAPTPPPVQPPTPLHPSEPDSHPPRPGRSEREPLGARFWGVLRLALG